MSNLTANRILIRQERFMTLGAIITTILAAAYAYNNPIDLFTALMLGFAAGAIGGVVGAVAEELTR